MTNTIEDRDEKEKAMFSRLPKWAQERIERLERDLGYSEKANADLRNNKKTRVFVRDFNPGESKFTYIQSDEVTFVLGKRGEWDDAVRVTVKDGSLDISGDSVLSIEMSASNRFTVKAVR